MARPSVVLVGATSLGRSLAPRLSTRFHTGLTADCTRLELRENTDLVQIRPAFGGNIMAQIVTTNTRPQFATVRYKVMDAPARQEEASGEVKVRPVPGSALKSAVTHVNTQPVPAGKTISDADILVVGGRGLQKEADLDMIRSLRRCWAATGRCPGRWWKRAGRPMHDRLPLRAHGASAADYHLRGERSDPVRSLHERQRTYRGHQQRRAGTDF